MPRAEWRSPAAYEDLRSLDAPGFAWEFLSRNPAFERHCKRLEHAGHRDPSAPTNWTVSRGAGGCDFVMPERRGHPALWTPASLPSVTQ